MTYKTYRTEIDPTPKQRQIIHRTIGVCRYLKNLYLEKVEDHYLTTGHFLTANQFDHWYRKEYVTKTNDWIVAVSSKARKQAIRDTEQAWIRFFKGLSERPRFHLKTRHDVTFYFCRNSISQPIDADRHRIKIPTLGRVNLKEKGYIPYGSQAKEIISGRIRYQAGRYYVTVMKENKEILPSLAHNDGIGIDLGLETYATANETKYPNINNSETIKRKEKQLKHIQRRLSRKQEARKQLNKTERKATHKNIDKTVKQLQVCYYDLTRIREHYENQVINDILRLCPAYITLETLNIKGLLKNKYLSKSIHQARWYRFSDKLIRKAKEHGIEVRKVSPFYPSSKRCSSCGHLRSDLKLSDRKYQCNLCGYIKDRDINASYNLKQATEYVVV